MSILVKILKEIDIFLVKTQKSVLIFSSATIILTICLGVIMRYFLKSNLNGMEEIVLLLGFWIYFLGGSLAFREDDHIEANILGPFLKSEKSKTIHKIIKFMISIPILIIVTIWSYHYINWSLKYLPTTVVYNIPIVAAQFPILLCYFLAIIYTFALIVRTILSYWNISTEKEKRWK